MRRERSPHASLCRVHGEFARCHPSNAVARDMHRRRSGSAARSVRAVQAAMSRRNPEESAVVAMCCGRELLVSATSICGARAIVGRPAARPESSRRCRLESHSQTAWRAVSRALVQPHCTLYVPPDLPGHSSAPDTVREVATRRRGPRAARRDLLGPRSRSSVVASARRAAGAQHGSHRLRAWSPALYLREIQSPHTIPRTLELGGRGAG